MNAESKLLDLLLNDEKGSTIQTKITSQINFPFTDWFTYRLGLFGGFTVGEVLNDYYLFRIGGIFDQNLGNFTRFSGYEFGQLGAKNILTNINTFQFKVYKNYFLNADFSIANPVSYTHLDVYKRQL